MKKIGFGRVYAAGQWYLPGTPFTQLPSPPLDGMPPAATAIDTTYTSPKLGAVYGGAVAVSNTTFAGKAAVMFDVTGTWDSVKNVAYVSDQGGNVVFNGFTQVDAVLKGGSVAVDAVGVKRANIVTDSGSDTIRIETLDNLTSLAGHEIRVLSGAGNDSVTLAPTDIGARLAAGDITYLPPDGGTLFPDGYQQTTYTDLGDGNDRFTSLGMTADWVFGGAGNDSIQAGGGRDTLSGGSGNDLFVFGPTDGYDELMDFNPGNAPSVVVKTTVTFTPGPGLVPLPIIPGSDIYVPQPGYGAPGLAWAGVFGGGSQSSLANYGITSDIAIIGFNNFALPIPGFGAAPDISAVLGMDLLQLRVYLGDAFGHLGTTNTMDRDGFTILGLKHGAVVAHKDVGLPTKPGQGQLLKFDASWKGIDEIAFSRLDGLAIIDDLMATVTGPPALTGVAQHIDFTSMDGVTELLSSATGTYRLPSHYATPAITWGNGIDWVNVPIPVLGSYGELEGGAAADRSISGHNLSLYGLTMKGITLDGSFSNLINFTVEGLVGGVVVAHADLKLGFQFGPFASSAYTFNDLSGFRNLDSIRFSSDALAAGTVRLGVDDLDLRVAPATRSDGFDKLQLLGLNAAQVQDVIDNAVQYGSDLLLSYGTGSVLTLHNVDKAELTLNDFLIG